MAHDLPPEIVRQRLQRLSLDQVRIERILAVDAKASLTAMRTLTERILAEILEDHSDTSHVGSCIAELLAQLGKRRLMPRRVRVHVRTLQELGNLGSHHQEDEDEPEADEAETARASLAALVKWYRQAHLGVAPGEFLEAQGPLAVATGMSDAQLVRARRYNRHANYNPALTAQLQELLGLGHHGHWDDDTIRGIHGFQLRTPGLARDGMLGPGTLRALLGHLEQRGVIPVQTFALTPEARAGALSWNLTRGLDPARVASIQVVLGVLETGRWDDRTTDALFRWQLDQGLGPDGMIGPLALSRLSGTGDRERERCPPTPEP